MSLAIDSVGAREVWPAGDALADDALIVAEQGADGLGVEPAWLSRHFEYLTVAFWNSTTHTQGDASHDPAPWSDSHNVR